MIGFELLVCCIFNKSKSHWSQAKVVLCYIISCFVMHIASVGLPICMISMQMFYNNPVFSLFRMIRDMIRDQRVRILLMLCTLNVVRRDGILCSASDHYPRCETRCPTSRKFERQACLLSCTQEYSSLMYRTKKSEEDDKRRPPLNRQIAALIHGLRNLQETHNKRTRRLNWPTAVTAHLTVLKEHLTTLASRRLTRTRT